MASVPVKLGQLVLFKNSLMDNLAEKRPAIVMAIPEYIWEGESNIDSQGNPISVDLLVFDATGARPKYRVRHFYNADNLGEDYWVEMPDNLAEYVTDSELSALLLDYVTTEGLNAALAPYALSADVVLSVNGLVPDDAGNVNISTGGGSSYELRGTGSPEGAVTASPGYYYTDEAGTTGAWRWLKTSGTGNTGWAVITGDTGWRDVSGTFDLTKFPGLKVFLMRTESTVVGSLVYPGTQAAVSHSTIGTWPAGFKPRVNVGGADKVAVPGEGSGVVMAAFLNLHDAGFYMMHNGNAASGSAASFRFETKDPWPTILPGTAV